MNILIDLRWMVIGKAGGMEQLAFELIASFSRVNQFDRIHLYCPRRTFREWRLGSGCGIFPIFSDEFDLVPETQITDLKAGNQREPSKKKLGLVEKRPRPDPEQRVIEIDLVHSIGGYIAPELRDYRNVVTVLDLQQVHHPEFFTKSEIEAREANHCAAIESSDRVICISKTVERDVCSHYSVAKGKTDSVWVIPSSHAWLKLKESYVEKTLKGMGLTGEFIFFPSHGWPHKNHVRLIGAFKEVRKWYPNLKLVLTGGELGSDHPALKRIDQLDLNEAVMHLGYRTPLEIRCLLQKAIMLVYPSLFEGFGLPVAEAIIAGKPVVCSNIAPLVEIGGDAVVTFNPKDESDVAVKILELIRSPSLRERLLLECEARRERFLPAAIGLKTINLYHEVCGIDPVEERAVRFQPSLRYEKGRHEIRKFERNCEQSNWSAAIRNALGALFNAPGFAWSVLRDRLSVGSRVGVSHRGRYGDGWIGPDYQEWFMVPQDSDRIEVELEPPPTPFDRSAAFRISVGGDTACEYRFEDGSNLTVKLNLPPNHRELIPLGIISHHSFIPKVLGFSDDARKLSMKLVALRWF